MTPRPQWPNPSDDVVTVNSTGEIATHRLGQALAGVVRPGVTVLMSGPLGAGKSLLARAVLRTCLGAPELDVPSPSYTLANVYAHPLARFGMLISIASRTPKNYLRSGWQMLRRVRSCWWNGRIGGQTRRKTVWTLISASPRKQPGRSRSPRTALSP